jgi:hypothetical protein
MADRMHQDTHRAQHGNDCYARMSTNNLNIRCLCIKGLYTGYKGICTDNVECGNSKDAPGIKDTLFLEHLGNNGNGRVNRVGDYGNKSLGTVGGNTRSFFFKIKVYMRVFLVRFFEQSTGTAS